METERLSVDAVGDALRAGSDYLELNRGILDNLNVYPVPDGDTGVNMVSTLKPAVAELTRARCTTLRGVSRIMSAELLRNGRGNSGFILAQFFRGFWEAAGEDDCIGPDTMKRGFERGSFAAVSSLLTPVQGTMITIIDAMAESMKPLDDGSVAALLEAAIAAGCRSLYRTPALLPILAEAGVVDAGALGFLFIAKGMLCSLMQREVEAEREETYRLTPVTSPGGDRHARCRYCVELELETDRTEELKELLLGLGESIALMAEPNRVRAHIHTNLPDAVIRGASSLGRVTGSKLDDMEEQIARGEATGAARPGTPRCVPVLSIIPGPGFRPIFEELGASGCLEYGHTLPSAEEVRNAVDGMDGEEVIVLPNDSNILPTVRLVREQASKRVHVIHTEDVVEGMTAMYGYSESESASVNLRTMARNKGLARTLKVYRASRDTTFGGIRIETGHYLVVRGDEVLSADASLRCSVVSALKRMGIGAATHLSFFLGDGFDASELAGVMEGIRETHPRLGVEEHYGGQRKSLLIISAE